VLERAVNAEEQRRKSARQEFHLTTCSILEKASYEVAFSKEHKDELGLEDGESCVSECWDVNVHDDWQTTPSSVPYTHSLTL